MYFLRLRHDKADNRKNFNADLRAPRSLRSIKIYLSGGAVEGIAGRFGNRLFIYFCL